MSLVWTAFTTIPETRKSPDLNNPCATEKKSVAVNTAWNTDSNPCDKEKNAIPIIEKIRPIFSILLKASVRLKSRSTTAYKTPNSAERSPNARIIRDGTELIGGRMKRSTRRNPYIATLSMTPDMKAEI